MSTSSDIVSYLQVSNGRPASQAGPNAPAEAAAEQEGGGSHPEDVQGAAHEQMQVGSCLAASLHALGGAITAEQAVCDPTFVLLTAWFSQICHLQADCLPILFLN